MRPLYGLLVLTFRELWAKRIVLGLFVISSLLLLGIALALNLEVVEGSLQGLRLFGEESDTSGPSPQSPQSMSLTGIVVAVESIVAGASYWIGILLALFASAGLFSDLQATGRAELLFSKPVHRLTILSGHALGVWAAIAALVVYLLGGTWLIMSLKSGIWNARFLLSIGIVVAMFAVMYGVMMLMSVWSKSTALTLIVAYGLIFMSIVLTAGNEITPHLGSVGTAVFWGLYHLLPNFTEVTGIVTTLAKDQPVYSWYPLTSSLLFGAATYGLTGYLFVQQDL
jgi:ABC-type transport system involved in multi-copper enzyme maturation permease subunit